MALCRIDALVDTLNQFTPCLREEDYMWMRGAVKKLMDVASRQYPMEGQLQIQDAMLMSADLHAMEYRDDDSTPYITHLLYVACMILDERIYDIKMLLASILHDCVELLKNLENALSRMKLRLREIRRRFGVGVERLVDYLTKRPGENKETYWRRMLNIKDKKIQWRVLVIKFNDRIHNIRTLKTMKSEEAQKRKIEETLKWFPVIRKKLEQTLNYLWNNLQIENKFYLQLPSRLENLLNKALEAHIAK